MIYTQNPKIDSLLRRISRGDFSQKSSNALSHKLLNLYIAQIRKDKGLHLRWQFRESIELAMLTVKDLRTQLKTRKNKIASAILKGLEAMQGGEEATDHFLAAAEESLKTESARQTALGNKPKREDPLNAEIRKLLIRQPDLTTPEIIDRLTSMAGNDGTIIKYDDHFIIYKDYPPTDEGSAAISGMPGRVARVRKNMLCGINTTRQIRTPKT